MGSLIFPPKMGADSSHAVKTFCSQIQNIFWKIEPPTEEKAFKAWSQACLSILRFKGNSLLRDDELDVLILKELTKIFRI